MMEITIRFKKYLYLLMPLVLLSIAGPAKAATTVTVAYVTSTCSYFVAIDRFGSYATIESFGPVYPSKGDTLTGNTEMFGFQDLTTQTGRTGRFWIDNYWQPFSLLQPSYKNLCNITLTQGTPTTTTPIAPTATIAANAARADCIMNWAAIALPTYFKWSSASCYYKANLYYVRDYPSGYNDLFFDVANDIVIVSGSLTGGQSLNLGKMDSLKPYTGC